MNNLQISDLGEKETRVEIKTPWPVMLFPLSSSILWSFVTFGFVAFTFVDMMSILPHILAQCLKIYITHKC